MGLQTSEDAKFYAIAAKFDKTFSNKDKDFVVQYSVKHEQKIDCGGGYLKLFKELEPKELNGDSEYNIMFGNISILPPISFYCKVGHDHLTCVCNVV